MFYTYMSETPVGPLLLSGTADALTGLYFTRGKKAREPDPQWQEAPSVFDRVIAQLEEYFAGHRQVFDLTLRPSGTTFQCAVLDALLEIPYGTTRSYSEIACRVGRPKAVRAVGTANGRNPIAIIIPCHRVIGANGSLAGFGGGLDAKQTLLDIEQRQRGLFR